MLAAPAGLGPAVCSSPGPLYVNPMLCYRASSTVAELRGMMIRTLNRRRLLCLAPAAGAPSMRRRGSWAGGITARAPGGSGGAAARALADHGGESRTRCAANMQPLYKATGLS